MSLDDFWEYAKQISHFAIHRKRGSLDYYHHLLVMNRNDGKMKCFEYRSTTLKELAKFEERDLSEDEIKQAIIGENLYFIQAPNYPNTEESVANACKRCYDRLNENEYALAYNNCEHIISYIMTGKSNSEQVNDAGILKKILIDTIQFAVCSGIKNLLSMALIFFPSFICISICF